MTDKLVEEIARDIAAAEVYGAKFTPTDRRLCWQVQPPACRRDYRVMARAAIATYETFTLGAARPAD